MYRGFFVLSQPSADRQRRSRLWQVNRRICRVCCFTLQQTQRQAQTVIVKHGKRIIQHNGCVLRQQQTADGQANGQIEFIRCSAAQEERTAHSCVRLSGLHVHLAADLHACIAPAGQFRENIRRLAHQPWRKALCQRRVGLR